MPARRLVADIGFTTKGTKLTKAINREGRLAREGNELSLRMVGSRRGCPRLMAQVRADAGLLEF